MKTNFSSLRISVVSRFLKSCINFIFISLSLFSFVNTNGGNSGNILNRVNETLISSILISPSGHNLILSWQVDKSAFNYFEVEKSNDGKIFSTIGLVLDAPENSNTCLFKAKRSTQENMTWYRIKGILKDGAVLYSPSSSFQENEIFTPIVLHAFSPNPFLTTGDIKYFSNQAGFAVVKLQNIAGETLLSKQSVLIKGNNNIQLAGLNKLPSGIYVARLIINGTVMVNQKVVKE